jgi:hypothetical protein
MFSPKKSKLMWYKIKNKKTLVLHLSNIYKLKVNSPIPWVYGAFYTIYYWMILTAIL